MIAPAASGDTTGDDGNSKRGANHEQLVGCIHQLPVGSCIDLPDGKLP
jgi:hypothetical protein